MTTTYKDLNPDEQKLFKEIGLLDEIFSPGYMQTYKAEYNLLYYRKKFLVRFLYFNSIKSSLMGSLALASVPAKGCNSAIYIILILKFHTL